MLPYFRPGPIELGPIVIQPWGGMVALGFLAGSFVSMWLARRRGLDARPFWIILLWLAPGAIVFGHLADALTRDPRHFLGHPFELLSSWSGLSSYGGFFGCAALAVLYFRRRRLDVLESCDVLVVGVAAGWAIGRLGCFFVHDHIGRPLQEAPGWIGTTIGALAVAFPEGAAAPGVPAAVRFELGLLDSILAGLVLIVLLVLARVPRRPGALVGVGVILYSAVRFWLDFLRNVDLPNADPRYLGLTPAQYGTVIAIALGVAAIRRGRRRPAWPLRVEDPKRLSAQPADLPGSERARRLRSLT